MRESLLPLAESLADGTAVDWDEAARQAAPEDQAFVRQLGVLAKLTEVHRTLSESSEETVVPFAAGISARRMTAMRISISRLPRARRVGTRTWRSRY